MERLDGDLSADLARLPALEAFPDLAARVPDILARWHARLPRSAWRRLVKAPGERSRSHDRGMRHSSFQVWLEFPALDAITS